MLFITTTGGRHHLLTLSACINCAACNPAKAPQQECILFTS